MKCEKCGLTMGYQDGDADGPCDQFVCYGTDTASGCWNCQENTEFDVGEEVRAAIAKAEGGEG